MAFLLNFFWESWHAVYLYYGYLGRSFLDYSIKEYLSLITYASFMDMLMLLLAAAIAWWLTGGDNKRTLFYMVAIALLLAIFVEIKGVYYLKEWAYLAQMPIIFGLGLSPLAQLPITGFLAWKVLRI